MKLHIKKIAVTVGLSALLGTVALSAQTLKAVATIPFAYNAGKTIMPSGKYLISQSNSGTVFLLRNKDTGKAIFVAGVAQNTNPYGDSKLTFSCYGHDCSLSQIWINGDSYKVPLPRFEREATNHLGVVALVSVPLLSHSGN